MGKRKILIHSLVFSPDGVSTAYLYGDIAKAFKTEGYDVVVLSTTPHFNTVPEQMTQQEMHWCIPGLFKVSHYDGIKVFHVPQKKFKSTFLRLAGFLYWHAVSFFIALFIKNVDAILSPSPPLTIGRINNWLGKIKRCKVIYNVQEIYPDILGKTSGIVFSVLSMMEKKVYDKSDAVTTIDQVFYNTIVGRFENKEKLHIIPNFVDTDLYHSDVDSKCLDKGLFPETDSLKLLYAGNIGFAQDWDTLVRLATKVREMKITFFVIGEGVMRDTLEKRIRDFDLDNICLLPYQPREMMPAILSYCDAQFIFMNPEMEGQGFPSKVYTIMACGRPLLVCSGKGTPIVNFLEPTGCAKIVTTKEMDVKIMEISDWLKVVTRESLREMGKKGEQIIKSEYSKGIVTRQYVDLVNNLFAIP